MSNEPALSRIAQIALTVSDIERAVLFYRDALRLSLLFRAPPALAFFDCGGTRLMLSAPEPNGTAAAPATASPSSSVLYFLVGDIYAAHSALVDRGVAFVHGPHLVARMPDHELWLTDFHDPDGNALALMAEKRG